MQMHSPKCTVCTQPCSSIMQSSPSEILHVDQGVQSSLDLFQSLAACLRGRSSTIGHPHPSEYTLRSWRLEVCVCARICKWDTQVLLSGSTLALDHEERKNRLKPLHMFLSKRISHSCRYLWKSTGVGFTKNFATSV